VVVSAEQLGAGDRPDADRTLMQLEQRGTTLRRKACVDALERARHGRKIAILHGDERAMDVEQHERQGEPRGVLVADVLQLAQRLGGSRSVQRAAVKV
jgi:hypothetical protein